MADHPSVRRAPATRAAAVLLLAVLATGCRPSANDPGPGAAPGSTTGAAAGATPADTTAATPDPAGIRAGLAQAFVGDDPSAADVEAGGCFARALTGLVTARELRDAGVLDASYVVVPDLPRLPESLATRWVDAQFRCTDFVAQSARARSQVSHGAIDAGAWSRCLRAALTGEQLRAAVVDTLTGRWDGPALGRLSAAQAGCTRAQH